MGISYRITIPELKVLSELASFSHASLFPELILSEEEAKQALEGLMRKRYVKYIEDLVVLDRVMSGLVKVLLVSERKETGGGEEWLYEHSTMAVLCIRDRHSLGHYCLIPFKDREDMINSGYGEWAVQEERCDG